MKLLSITILLLLTINDSIADKSGPDQVKFMCSGGGIRAAVNCIYFAGYWSDWFKDEHTKYYGVSGGSWGLFWYANHKNTWQTDLNAMVLGYINRKKEKGSKELWGPSRFIKSKIFESSDDKTILDGANHNLNIWKNKIIKNFLFTPNQVMPNNHFYAVEIGEDKSVWNLFKRPPIVQHAIGNDMVYVDNDKKSIQLPISTIDLLSYTSYAVGCKTSLGLLGHFVVSIPQIKVGDKTYRVRDGGCKHNFFTELNYDLISDELHFLVDSSYYERYSGDSHTQLVYYLERLAEKHTSLEQAIIDQGNAIDQYMKCIQGVYTTRRYEDRCGIGYTEHDGTRSVSYAKIFRFQSNGIIPKIVTVLYIPLGFDLVQKYPTQDIAAGGAKRWSADEYKYFVLNLESSYQSFNQHMKELISGGDLDEDIFTRDPINKQNVNLIPTININGKKPFIQDGDEGDETPDPIAPNNDINNHNNNHDNDDEL